MTVCVSLCTTVVHTAQNSSDDVLSYPANHHHSWQVRRGFRPAVSRRHWRWCGCHGDRGDDVVCSWTDSKSRRRSVRCVTCSGPTHLKTSAARRRPNISPTTACAVAHISTGQTTRVRVRVRVRLVFLQVRQRVACLHVPPCVAVDELPVNILTSTCDSLTLSSLYRTIFRRLQNVFCWFLHWISWMSAIFLLPV